MVSMGRMRPLAALLALSFCLGGTGCDRRLDWAEGLLHKNEERLLAAAVSWAQTPDGSEFYVFGPRDYRINYGFTRQSGDTWIVETERQTYEESSFDAAVRRLGMSADDARRWAREADALDLRGLRHLDGWVALYATDFNGGLRFVPSDKTETLSLLMRAVGRGVDTDESMRHLEGPWFAFAEDHFP